MMLGACGFSSMKKYWSVNTRGCSSTDWTCVLSRLKLSLNVSSSSFVIRVNLVRFIIISFVFFHLNKLLFFYSIYFQVSFNLKDDFVRGQHISKYHGWSPRLQQPRSQGFSLGGPPSREKPWERGCVYRCLYPSRGASINPRVLVNCKSSFSLLLFPLTLIYLDGKLHGPAERACCHIFATDRRLLFPYWSAETVKGWG